jgi:hypothetical protein
MVKSTNLSRESNNKKASNAMIKDANISFSCTEIFTLFIKTHNAVTPITRRPNPKSNASIRTLSWNKKELIVVVKSPVKHIIFT